MLPGSSDKKFREKKMKSGLLAAVAVGGLLLAAPASAQGVKIGILNDQSGVYADYGGKWSFEAAKMAIEDFGGEVLGHKIEIISADHQNKPDLASAIARRWYDVENVDMITELTTSSAAQRRHVLPATPASPTDSTGPTTRTRWRSAPEARWWKPAAIAGSS